MTHHNSPGMTRREFPGALLATGAMVSRLAGAQSGEVMGVIRGEPTAEKVGQQVFAAGGNAFDAIVAAAFTAAIVAPHQTGLGGYGGHATLALAGGKLTCVDFNSIAPAAAKSDMFSLDATGKAIGQKDMYGWLAAGVPGIPAGLDLIARKYGTKPLRELVQPALALARNGFPFGGASAALRGAAKRLSADPGSRELYFRDGKPLEANETYTNRGAAKILEAFATANSSEPYYRGEIAAQIAAAFQANGGLVTAADLAAYQPIESDPVRLAWNKEWSAATAPLTSGGPTIIQALGLLRELHLADRDAAAADTLQLQIEALRYAWQDRLEMFGDPSKTDVPLERLLDEKTLRAAAGQIEKAVAAKKPLPVRVTTRPDHGTIHLSAADSRGNLAALTLTHGGSFGANVTVPGLGLTLGHGMSRFSPHADHPNAPGPHKRPLNNMCPTIVMKDGRPTFALGARGGRKIPNAVFEAVLQLIARGKTLTEAVAAPRMHTEGTLAVSFEKAWPAEQVEAMKARGYTVSTAASATISAAANVGGTLEQAMR
jgi:gamma-glutamyltranspeptidase/glutathione hydrolase